MDVATHMLVPLGAAWAALAWRANSRGSGPAHAGRSARPSTNPSPGSPSPRPVALPRDSQALALAFGVAGAAPDIDGLFDWVAHWQPELYFLQHRGFSHTLVGAPVHALLVLGLLHLLARRWPRAFGLLRWRPAFWAIAPFGSWTHLLLDGVTYAGVPLLWPLADGRFSLFLFHWIVGWLLPVSLTVLVLMAVPRLRPRRDQVVLLGTAAVVVALVVVGAVRISSYPEAGPGELVFPRGTQTEWSVLAPVPGGWSARLWSDPWFGPGRFSANATLFLDDVAPGAAEAVARARGEPDYRGFRMGAFGPEVVQTARAAGGWNVTFTDAAQRFEAMHAPRWTPSEPYGDWGAVSFLVRDDGGVEVLLRGW